MRRWSHWTLRARMVVTIVAITALALTLALGTAAVLLRTYLVDQVDGQLADAARAARHLPSDDLRFRSMPPFGRQNEHTDVYSSTGAYKFTLAPATGPLSGITDPVSLVGKPPVTVGGWRVQVAPVDNGDIAVLAVSLDGADATTARLLLIGGGVSLLILAGLALGASRVVRLGLRPLTRMEDTAERIADGEPTDSPGLGGRVPDDDPHTETGRLGRALNTMLGRIQHAMDEQAASEGRLRRFLADASHELRTPLTSIKGFAELYRRGGTPPGAALDESMGRIEDEAARMSLLVDDLMLLASLDEQRPMERRPVDLLGVAADTVRDAHVREPGRFIGIEPLDGELAPVTVPGDEPKLRQVLTNLVGNALRHTPPGTPVTVRLGTTDADSRPFITQVGATPSGEAAVIEVADGGPGLSPEHASHVFERLYRADAGRARASGGTGLGLSIVAAIVTAHGGCVRLDTAPGEGATFRVLLPLRVPPA
ncbi:two-component sensor histidine kinase [Actinorhabdospora filicis]|uniref:histidine kinase n=1 Tax=Actinorhabdospora filicis TaxID=1785913 RepID=A0A9W6SQF7_9ACTN|nr:HAMP domain-containing sensor histidine kinase [Actinorhabdospora filicis]GLZ80463.1 two-component sensor histidine kinase [Actinorhabdospora filicis]